MTTYMSSKDLALVGRSEPASLRTLGDTINREARSDALKLQATIKSHLRSPALPGGPVSRCDMIFRSLRRPAQSGASSGRTAGHGVENSPRRQPAITFAQMAQMSPQERYQQIGRFAVVYDVAEQLVQEDIDELTQRFEGLAFKSPASLARPVLGPDGAFYEDFVLIDEGEQADGIIDCSAYPYISHEQWEQVAPLIPLLHANLADLKGLDRIVVTWLSTGTPYENILDSDAWSFYAATAPTIVRDGRSFAGGAFPIPPAVQQCAFDVLELVAKENWHQFAVELFNGRHELGQPGIDLPQAVRYLALEMGAPYEDPIESDGNRLRLPPMPVGVRVGLARALTASDVTAYREAMVRSAIGTLCSHFGDTGNDRVLRDFGESPFSQEVARIAQILVAMSDTEIDELVDAVEDISGSATRKRLATFQDVATMVDVLSLLPRSKRKEVATVVGASYQQRNAAHRFWNVVEPIRSAQHASTATLLDTALRLTRRYKGGAYELVRFLTTASALPEQRVRPTASLLNRLVAASDEGSELASYIFEALSQLTEAQQQTLTTERQSLENALRVLSGTQSRAETLLDVDWLQNFCRRFDLPVQIPVNQLPAIDDENVMAAHRMRNLIADSQSLSRRFPQMTRQTMGAEHAALRLYLQSAALRPLEAQQRAGSNERANALRMLALIESTPANEHVDIALLTALVWTAIAARAARPDHTQDHQEVANMRYSLAQSLAQCVEDDGHSVCYWGQGQRLLSVLGGYGFDLSFEATLLRPSVRDLLTQIGPEFLVSLAHAGLDEPTAPMVVRFVQEAMAKARQLLADETEVASFREQLRATLVANDWPVPQF